jgi:AbrB family looped-hinge helix DNA binding protein
MTVTLSSKGQLVIPKQIRQALALQPGTKFTVEIDNQGGIVLRPVAEQTDVHELIRSLRGILAGTDVLELLEEDHRQELQREAAKYGF